MMNNTSTNCSEPSMTIHSVNNISVALYAIVIFVSLIGNSLILIVIHHNRSMRTVTNLLICNCSVADLLITLVPTVWKIIDILKLHGRWPGDLPSYMCVVLILSIYLSVAASIVTLMIISVERFYTIMFPYRKRFTTKMLYYVVPLIWVIAFSFAAPVTFIQKVKYVEGYGYACIEEWPSPFSNVSSKKHYTIVLFTCLYGAPLFLMTFLYALIARRLAKTTSKTTATIASPENVTPTTTRFKSGTLDQDDCLLTYVSPIKSSDEETNSPKDDRLVISFNGSEVTLSTSCRPKYCKKHIVTKYKARECRTKRVINMLICIVTAFAVSWFPVNLIQFLNFFHPYYIKCTMAMPHWAYAIAFFMQYANSAINPLIYFGFSKTYIRGLNTVRKAVTMRNRNEMESRKYSEKK